MPLYEKPRNKFFAVNKFTAALAAVLILLISACSRSKNSLLVDDYSAITPFESDESIAPNKKYLLNVGAQERIVVFFGYGYNDADFVSNTLDYFDKHFVLANGEAAILPVVFPDDLKVGSTARISLLYDRLSEYTIWGMVLLGAPENTHSALAKLEDDSPGFPVISLFPQDDQMGTEALSDLVIDFETITALGENDIEAENLKDISLEEIENSTGIHSSEIPALLTQIVYYISLLDSPLLKNAELRVHASQMFGAEWKILPFLDAETGMHPVNHFVLSKAVHE